MICNSRLFYLSLYHEQFCSQFKLTIMNTINFIKSYGGRDKLFSPKQRTNKNLHIGDCVIRSIVHATGKNYLQVWVDLMKLSQETLFLPNHEKTYGKYLISLGWVKRKPKRNEYNRTYEVRLFPTKPRGKYIIQTRRHLTTIINGKHLDSWNCGYYRANSYWEFV